MIYFSLRTNCINSRYSKSGQHVSQNAIKLIKDKYKQFKEKKQGCSESIYKLSRWCKQEQMCHFTMDPMVVL